MQCPKELHLCFVLVHTCYRLSCSANNPLSNQLCPSPSISSLHCASQKYAPPWLQELSETQPVGFLHALNRGRWFPGNDHNTCVCGKTASSGTGQLGVS